MPTSAFMIRDHPRACGEHLDLIIYGFSLPGSSPRMRGTLDKVLDGAEFGGIIPAHAGNTYEDA